MSAGYPAPRERTIRIKIPANDVENPTSMLSFTKALPPPAKGRPHIYDIYIFRDQEVPSRWLGSRLKKLIQKFLLLRFLKREIIILFLRAKIQRSHRMILVLLH